MSVLRRAAALAVVVPVLMASGTGGTNAPVAARPAVGETLDQAPSSVSMAMSRKVDGPAVVTVKDPSGKVVSEERTTQLATNVAVDLRYGLAEGVYTVTYRIEGSRGPEGGTYQFAYRTGSPRKDVRTWNGYRDIPRSVSLPDDDEREQEFLESGGEKDEDDAPSTSTTETPGPDAGTDVSDDASPANDTTDDGGSAWPWVVGVVVLLGLGAGVAALVRRPRPAGHRDDT